jgi:hypothetical protein
MGGCRTQLEDLAGSASVSDNCVGQDLNIRTEGNFNRFLSLSECLFQGKSEPNYEEKAE